jgi:hypothetical protein
MHAAEVPALSLHASFCFIRIESHGWFEQFGQFKM